MNAHRIAASPWKPARNVDAADRSSCVGQETVKQMSLSHTQKERSVADQGKGGGNEDRCSIPSPCFTGPSAAYNPDRSWQLLGEAERWEHPAEPEFASHFVDSKRRPFGHTSRCRRGWLEMEDDRLALLSRVELGVLSCWRVAGKVGEGLEKVERSGGAVIAS